MTDRAKTSHTASTHLVALSRGCELELRLPREGGALALHCSMQGQFRQIVFPDCVAYLNEVILRVARDKGPLEEQG